VQGAVSSRFSSRLCLAAGYVWPAELDKL
jgi:hypothetical protein